MKYFHWKREQFYRERKWEEVAQTCRSLLEIDSTDRHALNDLAVSLRRLNDTDGALEACRELFRTSPRIKAEFQFSLEGPRYMRYIITYGKLLYQKGRLEQARLVLEPLKKAGVYFHEKHLLLSRIYAKKGRLARAAQELEEMQEVCSGAGISRWENDIMAGLRGLLEEALAARDADAAFYLFRAISKIYLWRNRLDEQIASCLKDTPHRLEGLALDAHGAMRQGRFPAVRELLAKFQWPELAARFEIILLEKESKFAESFAILRGIPTDSPFHFDHIRTLKAPLLRDPAFLRDFAECHLEAGYLEEAYQALHVLTQSSQTGLEDLQRLRDMRQLMLERNIWEDEARLGKHPDPDVDITNRILPNGPDSVLLPFKVRELPVRLSAAFRRTPLDGQTPDSDKVRFRLAENYLRKGTNPDAGIAILQEISEKNSVLRLSALSKIGLHFIRGENQAAAKAALNRFQEEAASALPEDLKPLYLELGDACEAAGRIEEALAVYGSLAALDVTYGDVSARIKALQEPGRKAQSSGGASPLRGRFADLKVIGRGGMGIVYRAVDPLFNRQVALKVLSKQLCSNPEALQRFTREAQAMSQLLENPGIIQIYEVGLEEEIYIAMELVEGGSLRELLRKQGLFPARDIVDLGRQVCSAIGYAHIHGILHRDIKPDNILLTGEGKTKIVDFGLAGIATATMITREGSVMGTGPYMSPEQIRGRDTDARSDIYSLGILLFELAAGQLPFYKGDLAHQHLHEPPPAPRTFVPDLPEKLESLILRCIEKKPEDRFPDCAQLVSALEEAL